MLKSRLVQACRFGLASVLLGVPSPSPAQVPACDATNRHYDPAVRPAVPVGSGRVFYVDAATGNDANDGLSEARAFRTIGRAVTGTSAPIAPGDTVRIKAGLYRER